MKLTPFQSDILEAVKAGHKVYADITEHMRQRGRCRVAQMRLMVAMTKLRQLGLVKTLMAGLNFPADSVPSVNSVVKNGGGA